MTINENRFRAIMAGTASNLTAEEILVRNVAYQAERKGEDPLRAVVQGLPHVQITIDEVKLDKLRFVSAKNIKTIKTTNGIDEFRTEKLAYAVELGKSHSISTKTRKNFDTKNNESRIEQQPYTDLTKSQKQFIEVQKIPYSRVFGLHPVPKTPS